MAEDALVQMLLEAAGGVVSDERDLILAGLASCWARETAGWQLHLHNSYIFERGGLNFWVVAKPSEQMLEVRVSAGPRHRWTVHVRHRIAHLGHALDVLAVEDLMPRRFSPMALGVLDDFATELDRTATRLWRMASEPDAGDGEEGQYYPQELRIRSATLNMAADRARAFPRAELAVML